MENTEPQLSSRGNNRFLATSIIALSILLALLGYTFLYYPSLQWQEHFEIFDDTWGIADPSYRNWSGKVKNTGPYPIRSAKIFIELKDKSGKVQYSGNKQIVKPSDPPMYPGNVKRFSMLLKYTKTENIDDTQTTYRLEIYKYQKNFFWKK